MSGASISYPPANPNGVTSSSNISDNAIVRGDGGAKGVQTSALTITDGGRLEMGFNEIYQPTITGGKLGSQLDANGQSLVNFSYLGSSSTSNLELAGFGDNTTYMKFLTENSTQTGLIERLSIQSGVTDSIISIGAGGVGTAHIDMENNPIDGLIDVMGSPDDDLKIVSSNNHDIVLTPNGTGKLRAGALTANGLVLTSGSNGTLSVSTIPFDGTKYFDGFGNFTVPAGLVAPLFDHYVDANNTNTTETDLYSDSISAGKLSANGQKISAYYGGIFTGAATATQQLKVYFGGTLIYDSGALAIGAATDNWAVKVEAIRVSASVVRCIVTATSDFATIIPPVKYTEVTGLTLANAQIIKITGTAAGVAGASNQITAKQGSVTFSPNA